MIIKQGIVTKGIRLRPMTLTGLAAEVTEEDGRPKRMLSIESSLVFPMVRVYWISLVVQGGSSPRSLNTAVLSMVLTFLRT